MQICLKQMTVSVWILFLIFFYYRQYEITIYGKTTQQLNFFFSFTAILSAAVILPNNIINKKAKTLKSLN